jgi:hypothetical protein
MILTARPQYSAPVSAALTVIPAIPKVTVAVRVVTAGAVVQIAIIDKQFPFTLMTKSPLSAISNIITSSFCR